MGWEVLVVPLIALGVWILNTIFNAEEAPKKRPGQRAGDPQRRPTTDLDQFLEEARRRREGQQQQRPAPPVERPAEPVAQERPRPSVPRPEAARPRPPEREREKKTQRPREQPRPSIRREPLRAQPAEAAPGQAIPYAEAVPLAELTVAMPGLGAAPTITARRQASPAIAQVLTMLRRPESAAAAFVLNAVLGPPLCRRR